VGIIRRKGGDVALHHVRSVLRPTTLEEAWKEKRERGASARLVGGGIDVVLYSGPSVTALIDLGKLGLAGVREETRGIRIGATTTMTEAVESPLLAGYAGGLLIRALKQVASPLQRNLATFGGTIGSAHPWSDVIPALLVLDAELIVYDGSERTVPLEGFLGDRRARGAPIICAIRLPSALRSSKGAFVSFTRTGFDVPLLNVACLGTVDGGEWTDVRIAIGGTPGLATRLPDVERGLAGEPAAGGAIDAAAESAAAAIDARDDARASAGYRRSLARVLVGRCLTEIVEGSPG
jgi:CO/xanthine dehydrogenase FAD-binding subunit